MGEYRRSRCCISGYTAAAFLRKWLSGNDRVMVISPQADYNWNLHPTSGLASDSSARSRSPSAGPHYRRHEIEFKQARAVALFPEGDDENRSPSVEIEWTLEGKRGKREKIRYDFLINATGPKLTSLRPAASVRERAASSVCTAQHAEETSRVFLEMVDRMEHGERKRGFLSAWATAAHARGRSL